METPKRSLCPKVHSSIIYNCQNMKQPNCSPTHKHIKYIYIYIPIYIYIKHMGFLGNSAGREFTCNSGDPGLISGSGRSPGEGIGYPLQYSWVSLVAQTVKNLPAMWETWVQSLSWEDPPEKGTATHSSIVAWRIPWTIQSMGSQRVGHN